MSCLSDQPVLGNDFGLGIVSNVKTGRYEEEEEVVKVLKSKVLLVVLLALSAGCAHHQPALSLQPRTSMTANDYEKVLEDWTREDRHDGLESKLFVHATFHSPEFRKDFLT